MNVIIEESTSDYLFARRGRLAIAIWRGRTSGEAMKRGTRNFERVAQLLAEPILLLTLVEGRATLPEPEARAELVRFLRLARGSVERSAVVIEGKGLRASSVRAIAAGASLFSRVAFPHRSFATAEAAGDFLAGEPGASPDAQWVVRALEDARRIGPATVPVWLPRDPVAERAMRGES